MSVYSDSDIKLVNKLIAICRDGEKFYQSAIEQVDSPNLRAIFVDMANVRKEIFADLSMDVKFAGEEPEDSGTVVGSLRQLYATVKKNLSNKSDELILVEQLEEAEDRALSSFRDAVKDIEDSALGSRVASALASLQLTHDKMRTLKLSLTA